MKKYENINGVYWLKIKPPSLPCFWPNRALIIKERLAFVLVLSKKRQV